MKIAHECPLSISKKMQEFTEYEFVTGHMLQHSGYLSYIIECKESGRQLMLFPGNLSDADYVEFINLLEPQEYVVPYVVGDYEATVKRFNTFTTEYNNIHSNIVAVPQGKSYLKYIRCYKDFANRSNVSKIAMSNDIPYYLQSNLESNELNDNDRMMMERIDTIANMISNDLIDFEKPHHLLNCHLPQELGKYNLKALKRSQIDIHWIESINASAPIFHSINRIEYDSVNGYTSADMIPDIEVLINETPDWKIVQHNITVFRDFAPT